MFYSLLPHECFSFCRICHYPIDMFRADSDPELCRSCAAKLTKIQGPFYCQKCGDEINVTAAYKKLPYPRGKVA